MGQGFQKGPKEPGPLGPSAQELGPGIHGAIDGASRGPEGSPDGQRQRRRDRNDVAGCFRCGRLGRRRSRGRTCRPATCCPRVLSVNAHALARPCPFEAPLLCHRSRDKSSPRAVRPDHGERQSPLPEIGAARNYTHFSPPVVGMPPSAPARPPACLAPSNAGWLHPGGAATEAARDYWSAFGLAVHYCGIVWFTL